MCVARHKVQLESVLALYIYIYLATHATLLAKKRINNQEPRKIDAELNVVLVEAATKLEHRLLDWRYTNTRYKIQEVSVASYILILSALVLALFNLALD